MTRHDEIPHATIEALYQERCKWSRWPDIIERLPDLRRYAGQCQTIVEFGVRTGNSTCAFLAGGAEVHSYDLVEHEFLCPPDVQAKWHFTQANTLLLADIPACDLLFIDSYHSAPQVARELEHERRVRKWIALHDVIEWGLQGQGESQGIDYAVFDFLARHRLTWGVKEFLVDQWGLLVLERFAP
jgi:hypothetical protein